MYKKYSEKTVYIYIYIKFSKIVTDSDTNLRTQVPIPPEGKNPAKKLKPEL